MERLAELQAPEMPVWKVRWRRRRMRRLRTAQLVENDVLMDSSDMSPAEWVKIARTIGENYYDYDGFVLLMGTDTMAYCASALSFLLENLGKPVVLTGTERTSQSQPSNVSVSGSQVPLVEVISDARRNLSVSMLIAGNSDLAEVCIFFNDVLLRGNRATKLDNWGVSAFDSPNFPALATLGSGVRAPFAGNPNPNPNPADRV